MPTQIVEVGHTEKDEIVETDKAVLEADLVIYVDMIQIPLNGGHKSVAVGLGTYNSIAPTPLAAHDSRESARDATGRLAHARLY